MQYLLQMSDELNDKYEIIDKRIDNILDKLEVLIIKNDELETRINANRDEDKKQYNNIEALMKEQKWQQRDRKQKNQTLKRKHWREKSNYKPKKKTKSYKDLEGFNYQTYI